MKRTESTFGLTLDEWEEAKDQIVTALRIRAGDRQMICYSDLAQEITAIRLDPHSPQMNHLLGSVLQDEHEAGRPLITAIVTHKDGDKEPGPGFYEMSRSLGYRFDEPFVFWATQVQEVFKFRYPL
ncbi:MAG: hypothetical protein ACREA0_06090 [bacterium]